MLPAQYQCVLGLQLLQNTALNPLASVAVQPPNVAKKTTKPLLVLLQKQSPGGCIIDMTPSNCQ